MPEHERVTDPNAVTLFAETNFRNQRRRFGIKLDDRRRHMYIIGKTGMGKTTMLENMVLSDVYAGHGLAYIDPHGDTAEKIIDYIPSWRINDVVYFNPADMSYPVGFNILETVNDDQKHLVGSGLMGVFKKIWPDVWSARMEYILLNCVLALLDYPGATLLGINRLLVDKDYRERVISKIRDPIVKTFWVAEFSSWSEKYATEAIAPVQNKVGQFLSASIIRNIVAQVKSTIDPRDIMDHQKIFIVNLSKGRIGEDNMKLLGGMIVTKLQLAAMERVDIPEQERKDFFMYVDEFQNFATPSFANILSEARKYRLSLIMAHQYIEQLDEVVRDAVFGNVGSIIAFRVGAKDAEYMETEFTPTFTPEDLANIPKYSIYLKLMVDGVSTPPFSANTLAPIAQRTDSREKVVAVSRERYAVPKSDIEEKVLKWSGMETGAQAPVSSVIVESVSGPLQYPRIETEEEQAARAERLAEVSKPMYGAAPASPEAEQPAAGGEYLRFSPERLAAIQAKAPAGKKKKPMFKHTCDRCGIVWEMPIQLDTSRPVYCAECLPLVKEEKKFKGKMIKSAVRGKPPAGIKEEDETKTAAPRDVLEKAMRSLEEDGRIRLEKKDARRDTEQQNRPRLVVTSPDRLEDLLVEKDSESRSELLESIEKERGAKVLTSKLAAMPPIAETLPLAKAEQAPKEREVSAAESAERKKRKRKRRRRSGERVPEKGPEDGNSLETPGSRVEAFFRDVEEGKRTEKDVRDEEPPSSIVFKTTAPAAPESGGGPRRIRPGERIRFDAS